MHYLWLGPAISWEVTNRYQKNLKILRLNGKVIILHDPEFTTHMNYFHEVFQYRLTSKRINDSIRKCTCIKTGSKWLYCMETFIHQRFGHSQRFISSLSVWLFCFLLKWTLAYFTSGNSARIWTRIGCGVNNT